MGQYDQMKNMADAAYRDPYERRYSMRNSEPKHDNYGDNHWQKTPRPTEWKMEKTPKPTWYKKEKTPRPTWEKTPKPTKEDKTPRPTWKKTPKPSEYGHGQWEKDNDYKYK